MALEGILVFDIVILHVPGRASFNIMFHPSFTELLMSG